MKRAYTLIVLAAIFLFAAVGGYPIYLSPRPVIPAQIEELETVELKGQTIRVSVADTPAALERGLSGRSGLAPDEGMLFVFTSDGKYSFWMKDMSFPIDILWLSAGGTVIYMVQNVSPASYPGSFAPDVPVRYVLELPAGWVRAHNVEIDDKVEL